MIVEVVGHPGADSDFEGDWADAKDRRLLDSLPRKEGQDFDMLFQGQNPDAIDLMRRMLAFDPS
jgi:mitogen-activated protein kinase 1/3